MAIRTLVRGGTTEPRFKLLFQLTQLSSDEVESALRDYFVTGIRPSLAASVYDVPSQNFYRAVKVLEECAVSVEKVKEIDLKPFDQESALQRFNILLGFTRICNSDIICALQSHLVHQVKSPVAQRKYGVSKQKFSRALIRLRSVSDIIDQIKQMDVAHLSPAAVVSHSMFAFRPTIPSFSFESQIS